MSNLSFWRLGYEGFVCQYMVSGPKISEFCSDVRGSDQFYVEKKLREAVTSPKEWVEFSDMPWRVAVSSNNGFVDFSDFYSVLKKVEMNVSVVLFCERDTETDLRMWSYMAAALFINGELKSEIGHPVYKPISYVDVKVFLKRGRNVINIACRNLGVRDTRNIIGLQVRSGMDEIRVSLENESIQNEVYENLEFLECIRVKNKKLKYDGNKNILYNKNIRVSFPIWSSDYETLKNDYEQIFKGEAGFPEGRKEALVSVKGEGYEIEHLYECADLAMPKYDFHEDTFSYYIKKVAEVKSANRGEFGFSIINILARRYLGIEDIRDNERFREDLKLINTRVDCSDFLICGILRYKKLYGVAEELEKDIKKTLLNFRYWMDMDGSDGMCFWSENHSLMFYSCMMFAGQLYPEEIFNRAGMSGREISDMGKNKVLQWISDVEKYGFEEFQSATYSSVTFAALLNLVDFAEDSISKRAEKLCDRLLKELCMHAFKGSVISPMGRVYRNVLYPFADGAQAIMYLIDADAPYLTGEGWLAYLIGSRYKIPAECRSLMTDDADTEYNSGNALIILKKTEDYCLTSVKSPRDDGKVRWENIRIKYLDSNEKDNAKIAKTHEYLKSANESFHGTSFFEPGTLGYQQHMWYAALSCDAIVFVNHPGCMEESADLRPGYWHGNGIMPAVKQTKSVLGAVYYIPKEHPVGFLHMYLPINRFDEVKISDNIMNDRKMTGIKRCDWLYLRKGNGYLALWSSEENIPYNDRIFDCELKCQSRNVAYVVVCGSMKENGSFDKFIKEMDRLQPVYDKDKKELNIAGNKFIKWYRSSDETQVL